MARSAYSVERLQYRVQNHPDLVTLDLVTNAKTRFLVTKSGPVRDVLASMDSPNFWSLATQ